MTNEVKFKFSFQVVSDFVTKKIDQLKKEAASLEKAFSTALGVFGGIAAFTGVSLGIDSLKKAISGFTKEALDAEEESRKLTQALSGIGVTSELVVKDFQDFADALELSTRATGEQINNLISLGLNLGVSRTKIKDVVNTALDLSAALGVSAEGAVEALNLALNGNSKQLGALLPAYKGLNAEQLKNRDIIGELQKRYGSFAENETKSATGALDQLNKSYEKFSEELGNAIIKSDFFKSSVSTLTAALTSATESLSSRKSFAAQLKVDLAEVAEATNEGAIPAITAFIAKTSGFSDKLGILSKALEFYIKLKNNAFGPPEGSEAAYQKELELIKKAAREGQAINAENRAIEEQELQAALERKEQAKKDSADKEKEIVNQNLSDIQLLEEAFRLQKQEQEALDAELDIVKDDEEFQKLSDNLGRRQALIELQNAREIQSKQGTEAAKRALSAAARKSEEDDIFAIEDFETISNKKRLANLQSTLNTISTLQRSNNKELFAIGKAAAISTATIDGIIAVQKALASGPAPFNFILAGLVGAATAANVAQIAAQQPPAFEQGGIVPGASFSGDKVLARVNSGELILNRAQQNSIASQLTGGGLTVEAVEAIANRPIVIQIDGREIVRAIRNQEQQGFRVA